MIMITEGALHNPELQAKEVLSLNFQLPDIRGNPPAFTRAKW